MIQRTFDSKIAILKEKPLADVFILADAKDADMAFGIAAPGKRENGQFRSLAEYRDQIRLIVAQGLVDIMLMSASTSEELTIREKIFQNSSVTPAVRANDTTDIHLIRGSRYAAMPSRPFASQTIDHIRHGSIAAAKESRSEGANLGLFSVTFNNDVELDRETMEAYKLFRLEAEEKGFRHFLEVFGPNVSAEAHGLSSAQIPSFVNDHIVRLLAGVPAPARPSFLKIPYYGPAAMEELCSYDPSLIVGVLGGSSGTTHDAFELLYSAKKYGARAALFGRKINQSEHQLSFVQHLRHVADGNMVPRDAVKSYHAALAALKITAHRSLEQDLGFTATDNSHNARDRSRKRPSVGSDFKALPSL